MFDADTLKVGDKVIVVFEEYNNEYRCVGEIVHKTRAGRLEVKMVGGVHGGLCLKFKKDGDPVKKPDKYGSSYGYLEEYTEEAAQKIEKRRKLASLRKYLIEYNYGKLRYEECIQVRNLLAEFEKARV